VRFVEQTNEVAEKLKTLFEENLVEIKSSRKRRIFVRIKKDSFKEALQQLVKDMKITHLSTITGTDIGQGIELLYHFAYDGSIEVTVGFTIPKDNLNVPTATGLIPGAVLYERELHEVLGVSFEGHPNLSPLVLPEGWPEGVYPLRKDRKFEELRQIGST
jgi:membrane-bound hydrogenase subunit beta